MDKEIKKSSKRPGKHRLSIDFDQPSFDLLKKTAEERDMTITKYVYRAVMTRIRLETSKK